MVFAARGTRDLDDGERPIEDEREKAVLQAQARGVYVRSILLAFLGAAVIFALPL